MVNKEISDPPDSGETGEQRTPGPGSRLQIIVDGGQATRFRITIESLDAEGAPVAEQVVLVPDGGEQHGQPGPVREVMITTGTPVAAAPAMAGGGLRRRLQPLTERWQAFADRTALKPGMVFFWLAVLIYLITRLIGLERFPIYFFTDEAIQTVLAADLVRDNFLDHDKVFLPTYFRNVYQYNLSTSVYLQVLPYVLFGKSIIVTRATSALVSLLAPLAVALTLRDIFKMRYWWSGALVVGIAPAWFLHSRTAFETVLATSFYAVFLYFYLLYRYRSPRYLYPALGMAALTFYSYSPAQLYIGATGGFLLLSDARYHWQNRRIAGCGLALIALLALPYLRFRLQFDQALSEHLNQLGSYWVADLPLRAKISRYAREYFYGLSPGFWFVPNDADLNRHIMKGYGHLLRPTLLFLVLGLILAVRQIREASYRTILVAFLAAPTGAAIVQVGITRLLVFVVPASLLITLGIEWVLLRLERIKLSRTLLAVGLFVILAATGLWMMQDALLRGPVWYDDYGLHGMQYGARQVFGAIKSNMLKAPAREVVLSHTWANGTDLLARFFFPDPIPIRMASIDAYLLEEQTIAPGTMFVLPTYEYEAAMESGKFTDVTVLEVLDYPNGLPGFYFVQMRYVDNIVEIIAAERAERAILLEDTVTIAGETANLSYPRLDIGNAYNIFDGDEATVARTMEANPFIIDLTFQSPRTIGGYDIIIGAAHGELKSYVYPDAESEPLETVMAFAGSVEDPWAHVSFAEPVTAAQIRVEVHDHTQGEIGHVHVWELILR